jgi:AraC-like DNA-binding protein
MTPKVQPSSPLTAAAVVGFSARRTAQPGWPDRETMSATRSPSDLGLMEKLFSQLPDVVFFVKDRQGRYARVNDTLLRRCGLRERGKLLGLRAEEVFPKPLGAGYTAQDQLVLEQGVEIRDKLELHLYPGGGQGWCLTFKMPLRDGTGAITGLVGISRDLHRPDEHDADYRRLARAVDHLQQRYAETVRLEALARSVGLSLDRFERLVKRVFYVTPRQLLTKTRIEAASRLLVETTRSIADVAYACGYCDHSAFTRQFKATVGVAPADYRAAHRASPGV